MNEVSNSSPATSVVVSTREPDYGNEKTSELIRGGWIGVLELLLALAIVWLLTFPCVWIVYLLTTVIAQAGWVGLVATALVGAFFLTNPALTSNPPSTSGPD